MKYEKLNESLNKNSDVTLAENDAVSGINLSVPGWSGLMHYVFFRELLRALIGDDEKRVSILMLGVYRGRDLRYISCAYHEVELFNRHRIAAGLELIGVDKFNELPCDDWPVEKLGLSWERAGFGHSPTIAEARKNLDGTGAVLVQANDHHYMKMLEHAHPEGGAFDAIYLDTSHDYETVVRQIGQARKLLKPDGILCGDDFLERPEWGVIRAVNELCRPFYVFGSCWFAPAKNLE